VSPVFGYFGDFSDRFSTHSGEDRATVSRAGLAEPVVDARLECALVQFCAEVARGSVITSRVSQRQLAT
jgi:hypothetical protein